MPDAPIVMTVPSESPAATRHVRAFLIVLGAAVLHAWLVWGYTGIFWGDHGRWLQVVARYAAGEVPYRDFAFGNPPLALWLVGGAARVLGTSYGAITGTMTALYLLTLVVFLFSLRRIIPDLVLAIALPSLLFAISYAFRHGASLPGGTDSPAGPVGFICILGAAWLMLETAERGDVRQAIGAGVLIALAVLSRHEFWGGALYLLVAGAVYLARWRAPLRVQAAVPVSFFLVLGAGLGIAIHYAGLTPVLNMLEGSGRAVEIALGGTPSLERLTAEVAATSAMALTAVTALWLCLAIGDRPASRWAGALLLVFLTSAAVHMGMSVSIGSGLIADGLPRLPTLMEDAIWRELQKGRGIISAALSLFDARFQAHLFPVILPPIMLAVLIARWNRWHDPALRGRLAMILGLCIALRIRRNFEGADWYNVLLELPAYALYLQLICGPQRQKAARAVRAALSIMIVLGLYAYLSLADGPFTLQGRDPVVVTHNGRVHWPNGARDMYHVADSLITAADPSGSRPVYALGASGGWNFFLHRRSPLPFTDGLASAAPPVRDRATALLHAGEPPFLIENRYALRPTLAPPSIFDWEQNAEPNRYARIDLPWFESVARTCTELGTGDSASVIRVFNCTWTHP